MDNGEKTPSNGNALKDARSAKAKIQREFNALMMQGRQTEALTLWNANSALFASQRGSFDTDVFDGFEYSAATSEIRTTSGERCGSTTINRERAVRLALFLNERFDIFAELLKRENGE